MEIKKIIEKGIDIIGEREYANPALESVLVLSKILNVDKSYIYTYPEKELEDDICQEFFDIIERRATGYPLQYLLGEKEFYGLKLHVEEGVLIPRPETELLVDFIINKIKKEYTNKRLKILDIGVGSGAISISVAKYCPNSQVYGVDIEKKPIKVANINKEKFGLENVKFFQGDLFEPIEKMYPELKFDIIISNPPYIRSPDIRALQTEVKKHEPRVALDGGQDGLDYYRKIIPRARKHLKKNGILIFEIGFDQGEEIKKLLSENSFRDISVINDLEDNNRIALGFLS